MKIQVVVDCEESFRKKAEYTLKTFSRVLGLRSTFSAPDAYSSSDLTIWYGKKSPVIPGRLIFIEAAKDAENFFRLKMPFEVKKALKFHHAGEEHVALFFNEGFLNNPETISSGDRTHRHLQIDIVASAFYFLSCWQEGTSLERDRHERFPAVASLQYQLGVLDKPVVNQYIEILREEIEKICGSNVVSLPRFRDNRFAVCMTHDIDYVRKWSAGILYREFVQYFLFGRRDGEMSKRVDRLGSFLRTFASANDPIRYSMQRILEVEREKNIHATYYFKAGVSSRHDTSYRLNDGYAHKFLGELMRRGHEAGLHPSYRTSTNLSRMEEEKKRLEAAIGEPTPAVRQHFLRFRVPETWRIQSQLKFVADSTLGFSDHEGFRAGICHPFRPFDIERDEVIDIWEVPLVAMDATFDSYRNKSAEESLDIIKTLIRTVKKHHGVAVLLFHNTCYDELDYRGWGRTFEDTLSFAHDEGAFVGSSGEVLSRFLESQAEPIDNQLLPKPA